MTNGYLIGDHQNTAAGTTLTITAGSSSAGGTTAGGAAGDFLVAHISGTSNKTVSSVVDSTGNTWVQASAPGGALPASFTYVCLNPTHPFASGATLKFTMSASVNALAGAVLGVTGAGGTSSQIDVLSSASSVSSATLTGTTATLSQATETLIACGFIFGGNPSSGSTPNAPLAKINSISTTALGYVIWSDDTLATTAVTFTETLSTSTTWEVLWIGIKTSSGVSVTGVVSGSSSASLAGTIQVAVSGVAASVASASPTGAVTGGAALTGVVANTTALSPVGIATTGVVGLVAAVASASLTGALMVGVVGVVSAVTSASPLAVEIGTSNITGAVAATACASPAGVPGVSVPGVTASSSSASLAGSLKIGVPGTQSSTSCAGHAGSIAISLTGVAANCTAASPTGAPKEQVPGVTGNTAVASPTGSITATASVTGLVAQVTSLSPAAIITAGAAGAVSACASASRAGSVAIGITGVAANVISASPAASLSILRTPLSLGAVIIDANAYGATVVVVDPGFGSALAREAWNGDITSQLIYGGDTVVVDPEFGGSIAEALGLGASVTGTGLGADNLEGFTMQVSNITLGEFNDELLNMQITQNSSPFNLTGYSVNMYLKTAAGVADSDPSTIVLSSTGGSPAISITSASLGEISVRIPDADLSNSNIGFYRVDVIDASSNQNTAIYGAVTITLL